MKGKPRLGVLLSGTGRTLENLLAVIVRGELPVEIAAVVSSHADALGLEKARRRGIPTATVDWRRVREPRFSEEIAEAFRSHRVDLVVMAGFIRHWRFPPDFHGKVINIHPALLPEFGGKGMYGRRVHEAVWKARKTHGGCTVHYVDDQYDHGPVILQRRVALTPEDTPDSIAAKVFAEECLAYPEAIRKVLGLE